MLDFLAQLLNLLNRFFAALSGRGCKSDFVEILNKLTLFQAEQLGQVLKYFNFTQLFAGFRVPPVPPAKRGKDSC